MKFVMYNDNQPGILTDAGVIDIGDLCPGGGQAAMVHLIANYDDLKSQLETRAPTRSSVWAATTASLAHGSPLQCGASPRGSTAFWARAAPWSSLT